MVSSTFSATSIIVSPTSVPTSNNVSAIWFVLVFYSLKFNASAVIASKNDVGSGSWFTVSGKNITPPTTKTAPIIASCIFITNHSKVVFSEPN